MFCFLFFDIYPLFSPLLRKARQLHKSLIDVLARSCTFLQVFAEPSVGLLTDVRTLFDSLD
jgi:hypothetical protein